MELVTHLDPDSFLGLAQPGLELREAENSLMLGAVLGMRGASGNTGTGSILLSIQNGARWSVAGVMTPPFPLVLAASSRRVSNEELTLLVQHLVGNGIAVSGVVAESTLATQFASLWTARSGLPAQGPVRQRIYSATKVTSVPDVDGQLRHATPEDTELVVRWFSDFNAEALNESDARRARKQAEERIGRHQVFLWEDSEPRAMAASARPTRNTITVNAVYTPPQWRRRGFATAAVARLTGKLLRQGYAQCVLYTDLSNPTSNSIYQRIGYEPVSDSLHILFESSGAAGAK